MKVLVALAGPAACVITSLAAVAASPPRDNAMSSGVPSAVQLAPGAPLVTGQGCDGSSANETTALFRWYTIDQGPQWLDLSLLDNGFAPGTFVTVGPIESWWHDFTWSGLTAGRPHFVRVNTLTQSGWRTSPTTTFTTPDCLTESPAQLLDILTQLCDGPSLTVVFRWFAGNPVGQQWIDLSTQDNGFAPNTFIGAGPFSAAALDVDGEGGANLQAYFWNGLRPDTIHYWRVNAWTGSSWITSAVGRFKTLLSYQKPDGSCGLAVGERL